MRSVRLYHQGNSRSDVIKMLAGAAGGSLMMSIPMYFGPMFFLPSWPVPDMLAAMLGVPIMLGWLIHFGVGCIYTALYLFIKKRRILVTHPWVQWSCYILLIYFLSVSSWLILSVFRMIDISDMIVLSYPYLLQHIVFAATMRFIVNALSPHHTKSNYDLL